MNTNYPFWNYRESPHDFYGSIEKWPTFEIKNTLMMRELFDNQTIIDCLAELTKRKLME